MNFCFLSRILYLSIALMLLAPRMGNTADAVRTLQTEVTRNAAYFFERAIAEKPTIHDVGERLRIP